jgi:hypothetical protein
MEAREEERINRRPARTNAAGQFEAVGLARRRVALESAQHHDEAERQQGESCPCSLGDGLTELDGCAAENHHGKPHN